MGKYSKIYFPVGKYPMTHYLVTRKKLGSHLDFYNFF